VSDLAHRPRGAGWSALLLVATTALALAHWWIAA